MSLKDESPPPAEPLANEKGTDAPIVGEGQTKLTPQDAGFEYRQGDWATRNGLTLNSFKPHYYGKGIVELDRSLKSRHLHMIAIGGSIGAGFFVGSGSALNKGVSCCALTFPASLYCQLSFL